jgi:hypothetical protein
MRITAAGTVAINSTANSVFVLDVFSKDVAYNTRLYQPSTDTSTYTSLLVSGAMTSAIGYFGVGGSTTGNPTFRDAAVLGTQSNHRLVFNTNDGERMRLTAGGNLLIGTTVDYTKLTVSNGTSTRSGITISDTNTSSLMMFAGASTIASIGFDVNGLRFVGGSTVGVDNGTEIMRLTTSYNVLIGTTTDAGYKLDVNGTGRLIGSLLISSVTSSSPALTTIASDWASGSTIFTSIRIGAAADTGGAGVELRTYSNYAASSGTDFALWNNSTSNVLTERLRISSAGAIKFNAYGSGTFTGTAAYNLAVDASGNIIETAGGVVDGSGTANYVTKWQDANTVTNSSITDDGATVTATAVNFVSQSNLGTAYTSYTTSGTTALFDTITRANAAIYQIVIVANPNSAGSAAYQDFYYGKVFIGTGYNGANVVDVINYHQESPMPRTLYGSGGGDLTVTAVMVVGGTEYTEVIANTTYTIRIKIAGYNVAGAVTVVRLQRIM